MTTLDLIMRCEMRQGAFVTPNALLHAQDLREAISARDMERALVAMAEVNEVDVRTRHAARSASSLPAHGTVDAALDLGLTGAEWGELVEHTLWFQIALGWTWFAPAAGSVIACGDLRWQALIDAKTTGNGGPLAELDGWPAAKAAIWPGASLQAALRGLSPEARLMLAIANALARERVLELHLLARKMLLPSERLAACIDELVAVGLAECPASAQAIALELTARELQDIAATASLPTTGSKRALVDRLMSSGHAGALQHAAQMNGWKAPVRIGGLAELTGVEAVAKLWDEAWQEARGDEDVDSGASDEWAPVQSNEPQAPTATWTFKGTSTIRAIAVDRLAVFGLDSADRLFRIDDGAEQWAVELKRPAAEWGERPVLHDGLVIVARDRFVGAFDAHTGSEMWRWSVPRGEELHGVPACQGAHVYQTSTAGLHAIDVHSGATAWDFRRRDLRSPTVDDDTVVVAVKSTALHVLDAQHGRPLARHRLDGLPRDYSPLLIGSTVIISGIESQRMSTVGIDVHTGAVRWRHRERDARIKTRGRPGEAVIDFDWTVWAVNARTGKAAWKRPYFGPNAYLDDQGNAAVPTRQGIATLSPEDGKPFGDIPVAADRITAVAPLDDGSAILAAGKHIFRAIPGTATRLPAPATSRSLPPGRPARVWTRELESHVDEIAVTAQVVVAASGDVEGFDLNTGGTMWRREDLWFERVAADFGLAIGTGGEEVVAVDARSGDLVWNRALDGPAGAPIVIEGRHAYLVDVEATLMCFDVVSGKERWRARPPNGRDGVGGLTLPAPVIRQGIVQWADVDDRVFAASTRTGHLSEPKWKLRSEERRLPAGLRVHETQLRSADGWDIDLGSQIEEVAVGDGYVVARVSRGLSSPGLLVSLH